MGIIIGNTILLACIGTFFLRIAGRKSISQMTIPQIMILLATGTVLGSEVSGKGMANTIGVLGTFILILILIEWMTLRSKRIEAILNGESVPVIQEGKLEMANLRKLRISVDDLEKRLRMAGISHIEDVKSGTIENNGELGYELFPDAKPITKRDMELMLKTYLPQPPREAPSLFSEVQKEPHRGEGPQQLQ
ncbi:DUF421 domain-containing protein [Gorillibacterium sp. sgz500922]|uniref:DUF421 domain-containing protein n=1 Tax=Gorillibacterium sp. sgz500922 TaxID=3446694 RepID=UPI003F672D02